MNFKINIYVLTFSLILYLFLPGCNDSPTAPKKNMIDSGSWYETGHHWPHDGHPVESENFIIYSDAASTVAREQLSQICEDALALVKNKLGITDVSIFNFPVGRNNKIHIYAYKNYFPTEWGGQAYYGGLMIYSLDNSQKILGGYTAPEYYVPLIKHELMHTVQTLIVGANDERVYCWFAEGIAIQISDDIFYDKIDSKEKLHNLTATYGMLNPISLEHSWTYPDIEGVITFYYYPLFSLAAKYLLDQNGQGKTYYDVRKLILDVSEGTSFDSSLANRFGLSQTEYEEQFFNLMEDYLP